MPELSRFFNIVIKMIILYSTSLHLHILVRLLSAFLRNERLYVSPDEDINAFMSLGGVMCINKGTLDAMDDDELAYIMAHELVHGEKRHSVNGVKKRVGLQTALSIYLGSEQGVGGVILGNIAANYISNAVFTKDHGERS